MSSIRSVALLAAAALCWVLPLSFARASDNAIAHGRYLVQFGGCNDCHTTGYAQKEGKVPDSEWLKGDSLGFTGPWGTTYPANLRLTIGQMSEDVWVTYAHSLHARPPMPSFTLNIMKEADLRDMYRFIKSLGAGGTPAPAYLPPGQKPAGASVIYPGSTM